MFVKSYETVFILNPVLSEIQMKDAVEKFKKLLEDHNAEIVSVEIWGLKKLAYPIQQKTTGFYNLIEFKAEPSLIATLELEFRRDERIIRYLTTVLDKDSVEYNFKRRNGAFNKKEEPKKETAQ